MAGLSELTRRGAKFLALLPEHCGNSWRFRVLFFRERGFRIPRHIRVGGQSVDLHLLDEEGVREDCMECLFHNLYGLGRELGEVRSILDIGANVGFFSLAARAHYPRAAIHAYEPNPRVLPLLRANTANLDVEIFPEALGGLAGAVLMDDQAESNAARTRSSTDGIGILQLTLETAIQRIGGSVDLLKLDCEGAEWEILSKTNALAAVRHIRMEYHLFDGQSPEQILRLLTSAGFSLIHVGPQHELNGIVWASRG